MNFLLTNDDGIDAPGLWAASRALAELGRVLIVAPNANYSGYGAALPPSRDVFCEAYPASGVTMPGIAAFSLAAPPAVCAQVGLSGALSRMPIDLVVSGINHGANLGRDVLYSGTVGAALTAYLLGKPAIAISLDAKLGRRRPLEHRGVVSARNHQEPCNRLSRRAAAAQRQHSKPTDRAVDWHRDYEPRRHILPG